MKRPVIAPNVFIRQLGRIRYKKALEEQQARFDVMLEARCREDVLYKFYHEQLQKGHIYDLLRLNTLLLCEHPPVYTNGKRAKDEDHAAHTLAFKKLGAEYYQVDRGGLITFHGPGQLVCYPILDLSGFQKAIGPKYYVWLLESVVMKTCRELGVRCERTDDTGIWVGNNKICSLGVKINRRIVCHGLALNCNVDLDWFNHIVPCGLKGKGVTSLSKELGEEVTVEQVTPTLVRVFEELFKCNTAPSPEVLLPTLNLAD